MRKRDRRDGDSSRQRNTSSEGTTRGASLQGAQFERVSNIEDNQAQRRQEDKPQSHEERDAKTRNAPPPRNPLPLYCELHGEVKGHTKKNLPACHRPEKEHGSSARTKSPGVSYQIIGADMALAGDNFSMVLTFISAEATCPGRIASASA